MINNIKRQFKKSYKTYNDNAIVQKDMAERLVCEIFGKYENILEIGCGTGLLTRKISNKIEYNKYIANDIVIEAQEYIKHFPYVEFLAGDILQLDLSKNFDLIVSNAVFQWFSDISESIIHIQKWLKPNGILAFSTFSPDNFKEFTELTGISLNYPTKEYIKSVIKDN